MLKPRAIAPLPPGQARLREPSPPAPPPKRKKIDLACASCRKRKAKCDGAVPACTRCCNMGAASTCNYTPIEKAADKKRKFSQLNKEVEVCKEFFSLIESNTGDNHLELLRRLRLGDSVRSLVRVIKSGNLAIQNSLVPDTRFRYTFPLLKDMPDLLSTHDNPYLTSKAYLKAVESPASLDESPSSPDATTWSGTRLSHFYSERPYQPPYRYAKVVETRIEAACISKWTEVKCPEEMLKELMHLYFLHEYPTFAVFHKNLFLNDLLADQTRFCSSLLVNSILAVGCHSYHRLEDRAKFWNPRSPFYRFSAEVRRLRDLEASKPTVTTIQSGLIMSRSCNMMGIDKVGWSYLLQTVEMAQSINLFSLPREETSLETQRAMACTAWAVFCWQSEFCFHFFWPPLLSHPPEHPLPDPTDPFSWYPDTWVTYPGSQHPVPLFQAELFHSIAKFRSIMNEISLNAFTAVSPRERISLTKAREFHFMLQNWYKSLPHCLSAENIIFPSQIILHAQYFHAVMMVMAPLTDLNIDEAMTGATQYSAKESPADIVTEAKVMMETILRIYYIRHGFDSYDPFRVYVDISLGYMAFNALSEPSIATKSEATVKGLQSTLALAALGLQSNGKSCFLAQAVFCLLRRSVKQAGLEEVLRELSDEEDEEEEKAMIIKNVRSKFPVNIASIDEDPTAKRLDNLIAVYKHS